MTDFKELEVWRKSKELVKDIYDLTKKFPKDELQGLTNQIRSNAISISSEIAKGNGKNMKEQFEIALSTTFALQSQLLLALDLGYLWNSDIEILTNKIEEIQKLLSKK